MDWACGHIVSPDTEFSALLWAGQGWFFLPYVVVLGLKCAPFKGLGAQPPSDPTCKCWPHFKYQPRWTYAVFIAAQRTLALGLQKVKLCVSAFFGKMDQGSLSDGWKELKIDYPSLPKNTLQPDIIYIP